MVKRIISISSGKGGVGKTSLAINLSLALSQYGKTTLVDLDTGTSSIRNVMKTPVRKDLYHFFRKGEKLDDCISTLGPDLDKSGSFPNFGFVASPPHMIDAIANMNKDYRNRIIDGINELDANYVVLDLKAGLDPGVIDFLPQSNTGILVFTPNHPAATMAASDITKAILFRKLRNVFHEGSPVYQRFRQGKLDARTINQLLDQAEDYYEEDIPNLDAFLEELERRIPGNPILAMLTRMVEYFRVYYVLNRFSSVKESFDTAVKPFVENITRHVSSRVNIHNLGWIIDSERYHQANTRQIPFLLHQANEKAKKEKPKKTQVGGVDAQLADLYRLTGLRKEKPDHEQLKKKPRKRSALNELESQLTALETMFQNKDKENERENFDYILSSIRYMFQGHRVSDFGDVRLFKEGELVQTLLASARI